MSVAPRRLPRRAIGVLAALALGAAALAATPGSATVATAPAERHPFVTSFDGTRLQVNFFPAAGLRAGQKAPVLLIAHGYGEAAPKDPDGARLAGAPTLGRFLKAGYNVVTWDARGHGNSEGMAMLDSPDFEGRDVKVLIDWIARQSEVQLDRAGDPRLGMSGASYGGIIQFLTAAHDKRVDAISPGYTAYDLVDTTLLENGKFKDGWGMALAGMTVGNLPGGLQSPLGPQLHLLDPEAVAGITASLATGTISPEFRSYLRYRSPRTYLSAITAPTLLQFGTSDTLFSLNNAVSDFMALKRRGVPVKMVWNCEGHSLCPGDAGPLADKFDTSVLNWMDRWVKRKPGAATGRPFEWIASNEAGYRSGGMFPPKVRTSLVGTGSGAVPLTPAGSLTSASFVFIGAQPSPAGLNVPIPAPSGPADIVGSPRLTLAYSGTAVPAATWVYAQIVDTVANKVVGVQQTPVPVTLDGAPHTTTIDLNPIAARMTASSRYQLQLVPGSMIYGPQRSLGLARLDKISISLPVIDPAATPALAVTAAPRKAAASRLAVPLRARYERYRSVRVTLSKRLPDGSWALRGRTGPFTVGLTTRTAYVGSNRVLVPGRYRVVVTAVDAYGTRAVVRRAFTL